MITSPSLTRPSASVCSATAFTNASVIPENVKGAHAIVTIVDDDHVPVIVTRELQALVGRTRVGRLRASDPDPELPTWRLTGGADQALFTLDAYGELRLKTARTSVDDPGDANDDGVYELTVEVSDGFNEPQSGEVLVRLVAELPPQAPGLWWRRGTQDERDITLHWSPPADDGNSPILRYEYRVAGPAALSAWKEVPGGADARSVAPGRLEYGRSHFYSVRAVNAVGAGESYARWVVMYPGEPRAPQNLTAEAFSPWDVLLSWERPAHGPDIEIIAYRVDVSWDGLDWISSFMLDADDEEWPRCADPSPDIRLWCEWFRLDDPTPTTWDRIGRESVRYFRVAAVYHYVPVGRYSQKQGPVSAPVRASTEGWAAAHPLVSVTLVSSSHRNYGKVKDGDTVVLADPAAGEYSLRVWPDVGVTVGSVYLELDGPVQYARTENERPYSLHGDWGTPARLAYGKPLPAGDYTFRATAYPEPDRGGEPIQTLTVSFTVVQEQQGAPATRAGALTAAFEGVPERHAGAAQELVLGVVFSEEVTIDEAGLREHALAVSGATVTGAARVAGEPGAWAVTIAPESVAAVQVRLVGERPCEEAGAICTVDGRRLSTELLTRIAGPVLTEVVLVDAAAGEDLGPVADGAVVVVADPDGGSYGLRVETALDAVVASVRLELTGPGAEDEVSVIANEEPYTLYGATDGVEHGEALPEGDYTLRATAHADADAEGEPLGRLAVSFTVSAPVLAQVVLVDAAAGEDLGPVADGAVVVVADPDGGSYGLRVETALGAVLGQRAPGAHRAGSGGRGVGHRERGALHAVRGHRRRRARRGAAGGGLHAAGDGVRGCGCGGRAAAGADGVVHGVGVVGAGGGRRARDRGGGRGGGVRGDAGAGGGGAGDGGLRDGGRQREGGRGLRGGERDAELRGGRGATEHRGERCSTTRWTRGRRRSR